MSSSVRPASSFLMGMGLLSRVDQARRIKSLSRDGCRASMNRTGKSFAAYVRMSGRPLRRCPGRPCSCGQLHREVRHLVVLRSGRPPCRSRKDGADEQVQRQRPRAPCIKRQATHARQGVRQGRPRDLHMARLPARSLARGAIPRERPSQMDRSGWAYTEDVTGRAGSAFLLRAAGHQVPFPLPRCAASWVTGRRLQRGFRFTTS